MLSELHFHLLKMLMQDAATWKILIIFVLGITPSEFVSVNPEIQHHNLTYRLPTNVKPLKYVLNINVDMDNIIFSGNVTINLAVTSPTTSIHLNYKEIWLIGLTLDFCSMDLQNRFKSLTT